MSQRAKQFINELAADLADLGLVSRTPNFRYFQTDRKDPMRFCWTTQPTGDGKFWALTYRVRKDGTWILKKKRGFRRRKIAKKRTREWLEKYRQKREALL